MNTAERTQASKLGIDKFYARNGSLENLSVDEEEMEMMASYPEKLSKQQSM